ncbi:MAG: DUF420 domain-containing protein [Verrucomicrobiota bacterium JB023]|nr:DUF420 domain-containing protein [Verrucomicrobiota bacterium JB023]
MRFLSRPSKDALAGKLRVAVWIVTILVWILVALMRSPDIRIPLPEGTDLSFLPGVNAVLNSLVAVLLVAGLWAVLQGRIVLHQRMMGGAALVSTIFLLCYVAYHFTNEETRYGGEGWVRTVYFIILFTHIALAALSFPFILLTLVHAITNRFGMHKRLARVVYPAWLYVAVTGPIVYLMLKPYY